MWRLGDSYLSMPLYFPRKRGGGALPLPIPRCGVAVIIVSKQSTLLGGEGAVEIGSYNKITKFLKNTS